MTDPNAFEQTAMAYASDCAGEFIDSVGITDMAKWSAEQWQQFVGVICGGYVDALLRQQAEVAEAVGRIQTVV